MPNTASAKKRHRQDEKLQVRNRSIKRTLNTQLKQVSSAIAEGDIEKSEQLFRIATKKIDQAASKNIVHANAAARLKSRYSKKLKAAKGK